MPHYNEKQQQQQKSKNKNFTAKAQHLNLNAPSNIVKLQSDKTLTTQIYLFLNTHHMGFFLNESR